MPTSSSGPRPDGWATQDLCTSPTRHAWLVLNPLCSGLFSFASTTLILSFYNTGVRDIATPNVVVGMALGVGGLAQLLAGMWEFATGNTFGATGEYLTSAKLLRRRGRNLLSIRGASGATPLLDRDAIEIHFTCAPSFFRTGLLLSPDD